MQIPALVVLACAALSGCNGPQGSVEPRQPNLAQPRALPTSAQMPIAPAPRQQTRVTERDDDADGIADYRVFVTESFDAEGNLVSVTTEQDFEADGVIDERETTNFR
jgi:hypothetical protein